MRHITKLQKISEEGWKVVEEQDDESYDPDYDDSYLDRMESDLNQEIFDKMEARAVNQGRALDSPYVGGSRTINTDISEMRRRKKEHDDPLDIEDTPSGGYMTLDEAIRDAIGKDIDRRIWLAFAYGDDTLATYTGNGNPEVEVVVPPNGTIRIEFTLTAYADMPAWIELVLDGHVIARNRVPSFPSVLAMTHYASALPPGKLVKVRARPEGPVQVLGTTAFDLRVRQV